MSIYSWQQSDYQHLINLVKRLPSSILLYGTAGIGASDLAMAFSGYLLCEQRVNEMACGNCRSCSLLRDNSHPDFYRLEPDPVSEKKNKIITVAEVRSAIEYVSLTTHLAQYKIILIANSNCLNLNSANALLKILEEPPITVLFILLADNLTKILPTIKSRCYKYELTPPTKQQALAYLQDKETANTEFWLAYYNNSPLFEIELSDEQLEKLIATLSVPSIENIFSIIEEIDGKNVTFTFFVDFMLKWLSELAAYKLSGNLNYFVNYKENIKNLSIKLFVEKIFYLVDKLTFLALWTKHPLNYKLHIENSLFQYQQLFVK